jgi:RNA polymerase sigma factor (TIGR02999 family)
VPSPELTRYLEALRAGEAGRVEGTLMPLVYDELRTIASACMRGQRVDHTLQPTALVNEAFLKLFKTPEAGWNDRKHFYAVAARAMRQLLVDHARARRGDKRGGGRDRLPLDVAIAQAASIDVDLIDLDAALTELSEMDRQQAQVVELRYFAGLEMAEIADALGVSKSTVEREWRFARAWLGARMGSSPGP